MTRGVVAGLRDVVPLRALTRQEAFEIAQRQADRFLELVDLQYPPFPEQLIASLPRLRVERLSPIPVSGSTHWATGRWNILLNGAEPAVRQRFSLAHELKHIVDHPFVKVLYPAVDGNDGPAWVEQVCDYFAANLLMPSRWIHRSWRIGMRDLPELALRFRVSQQAMQYRLSDLGLMPATPRCGRQLPAWNLPRHPGAGSPAAHQIPATDTGTTPEQGGAA